MNNWGQDVLGLIVLAEVRRMTCRSRKKYLMYFPFLLIISTAHILRNNPGISYIFLKIVLVSGSICLWYSLRCMPIVIFDMIPSVAMNNWPVTELTSDAA